MAQGVKEVIPPSYTTGGRLKTASPQINKYGRKVLSNASSPGPVPVHCTKAVGREVCLLLRFPTIKGQGEECRGSCVVACRWHSQKDEELMPNVTVPEHSHRKLHPHCARSNDSGSSNFSPSLCEEKQVPEIPVVRNTLVFQSFFLQGYAGHEAMEN